MINDRDKKKKKAKLSDFNRYLKEFAQSIGLRLDFSSITPDNVIALEQVFGIASMTTNQSRPLIIVLTDLNTSIFQCSIILLG